MSFEHMPDREHYVPAYVDTSSFEESHEEPRYEGPEEDEEE